MVRCGHTGSSFQLTFSHASILWYVATVEFWICIIMDYCIMYTLLPYDIPKYFRSPLRYMSSVPRNFFSSDSPIHPPSGSTASIHLETAMMCFASFELTHTRPLRPVAVSRGKREPSSGSRKCLGSSNLGRRLKTIRNNGNVRLTVDTSSDCSVPQSLPSALRSPLPCESVHQSTLTLVPCLCARAIPVHITASRPMSLLSETPRMA